MTRQWSLLPQDQDLANLLAQQLGVHAVVGRLLVNRGVRTIDQGRRFLDRKLVGLHDPALLPGIAEAADRIHQAVLQQIPICIYGDYDVDGMCAAAILIECLRLGGARPKLYVPDRCDEGYGVNADALRKLRDDNVGLVVTVDCGITSVHEAKVARELGLSFIVTDHHQFGSELPAADVLVHPRLPGSRYPFGDLCGTGVAFKLAWELGRRFSGATKTNEQFQTFLLNATSLAAIGTVCDVVPLIDENRILVYHGLNSLRKSPPVGLRMLMELAGLNKKPALASDDLGFQIGPRLNACGRLGQARLGVELLVTRNEQRAGELARYLDEENKKRQTIERRMFAEAKELYERLCEPGRPSSIVLASDDWHPGVVGIVAGRMVSRFHRPCILISMKENEGAGSGRSIPGFDLHEALSHCREYLDRSGGHAMAAGLRIARHQLEDFRQRFEEVAASRLNADRLTPRMTIDAEAPLHALTPPLWEALQHLAPFGEANPAPLFLATNLVVDGEPKCVGGGSRHLSFRVRQGDSAVTRRAIAFGMAERATELMSVGRKCCLVFTPSLNSHNGYQSVDLQVKDLRPGAAIDAQATDSCEPQLAAV